MKIMPLLLIVAVTGGSFGCGQKGPLTLPDAQRPHRKIGLPKSSPAPAQTTPPAAGPPSGSAPAAPTNAAPAAAAPRP